MSESRLERTMFTENVSPVIHFTLAAAIDHELPLLLVGQTPDPPSSELGTGNWDEPPRALLLGGAYGDEDIARLQKLVDDTPDARRIPWLRVDSTKKGPSPGPEYAIWVVSRLQEVLKKLEAEGKLNGEDSGVYLV
jgi:hypothetical protein